MAIINISTAKIKDKNLFQDYIQKAAALMSEQNIEVLCRGKFIETKCGALQEDHIMAIFKYRDLDALNFFYDCDQYKKLIPLRDKACDMTINIYSE